MKKYILIFALFSIVCKAQSPVKSLYLKGGDNISGAYYKDIDNDFNKFVGTWEYVTGTTSFKIVFQKKQQIFIDEYNAYYDVLIGEYRYIENGIEKVNTLAMLDSPPADIYNHNIVSGAILKNTSAPVCNDCATGERRVALQFSDPTRPGILQGLSGEVIVRRADVGLTQKIRIILQQTGSVIPDANETPTNNAFNVAWGEYTLTKVN